MPEILHATGIASDMRRIRLLVEKDGKRQSVTVGPAGRFPMLTGEADRSWLRRPGWIDARDRAPAPLWLSDPTNPYWCRYLGDQRAMYCQVNAIQQKAADSLRPFIARAIANADSAGAERFVLDLRLNGGGNGSFSGSIFRTTSVR